jgi:hypothetical protein
MQEEAVIYYSARVGITFTLYPPLENAHIYTDVTVMYDLDGM